MIHIRKAVSRHDDARNQFVCQECCEENWYYSSWPFECTHCGCKFTGVIRLRAVEHVKTLRIDYHLGKGRACV